MSELRVGAGEPPGRPQERLRVTVRDRQWVAGERVNVDEDVLWPKNWPLPEAGSVVTAGAATGFVDHIEYNLDSQRIWILIR